MFPLGCIPRAISLKKDSKRIASLAAEVYRSCLIELSPFETALCKRAGYEIIESNGTAKTGSNSLSHQLPSYSQDNVSLRESVQ